MKFFHISDLHIGKRVNGFSMLEDQKYILSSILELVREHRPDGVWIAGDLYDKSMPSAEAVETADWFLSQLAAQKVLVWMISGNHDSAERVAYAGRMLEQAGIYVSRAFDGKLQGYCVQKNEDGKVCIVPMQPVSKAPLLKADDAGQQNRVSGSEGMRSSVTASGSEGMRSSGTALGSEDMRSRETASGLEDMRSNGTASESEGMRSSQTVSGSEGMRSSVMASGSEGMRSRETASESDAGGMQVWEPIPEICADKEKAQRIYIWLLPYLRPAQVRRFFPTQQIETTQQAVRTVLESSVIPQDGVNVLLMHQFLAGADVCDSEELSVGGLDQVDVSMVDAFDYVALGHLHRPQSVGRESVRYCGSPLKYSFSEAGYKKSVTVVEIEPQEEAPIGAAGGISIRTLPLVPRLDLREIRGPFETIMKKEVYDLENREDYLHITLTDQEGILDAIGKLREVYPNIMKLDFAQKDTPYIIEETEILVEEKTPQELFEEFFERQNGRKMSEEQRMAAADAFEKAIEMH